MSTLASRKNAKASPVADKATAKKATSKKPAVTKIVQLMQRHTKDTAGTLRFAAVNKKGVLLEADNSEVNQLYVRRSSPAMGNNPRYLRITVEVLDRLPTDSDEA